MAVDWSRERVEELTRMWNDGLTARQIAEELGDGITRNSVIGKANRLGLSKPTKSSVTRQQRKVETRTKLVPLKPPSGEGVNIFTLTSSTCRWPLGDPTEAQFRFCGSNCESGHPYCEYHAALAYQAP